jgi:hypothetical protein
VNSPSDTQPPMEPAGPAQSSTQEIPVVQPSGATAVGQHAAPAARPPHPHTGTLAPVDAPQPTGPVDFVPGLPGVGTPPPPSAAAAPPPPPVSPEAHPATAPVWPETLESDVEPERAPKQRRGRARTPRAARDPRDRAAAIGVGLAVLSLVLLELGLSLDFGVESYWSALPLWSAFATLCVVLAVLAFVVSYPAGSRIRPAAAWRIAAGGLVGLAVFWLLVVLPVVASDRGFLLTAALGALGAALWIGPGRKH